MTETQVKIEKTDDVLGGEIVEDDDGHESEDSLDEHIEMLKSRVKSREDELAQLKKIVWNKDPEKRTLYVGQVDLSTQPDELYFMIFQNCGKVEKISIHTDSFTSLPGGFAYVEFSDLDGAEAGLKKNGLNWRGLKLQICHKNPAPGTPQPAFVRLDYGLNMGMPLRPPLPGLLAAGAPIGGKGGFKGNPIIAGKGAPVMLPPPGRGGMMPPPRYGPY
eukprot:TRINITY_DN1997_c0_g5_i1.p2 TRINITY_DN1997_c0_g5~~TRINITY_DN1997_c0_g5_i1.p2  ORF type:complete len:218 (+),score=46.79 TRINITY_DN1997_c0_g5_i1:60-713(+)